MIGKRLPIISYNGLDKDTWIECQAYLQDKKKPKLACPGTMGVDPDNLRKSSEEFINMLEESGKNIPKGKFVDIGKIESFEEDER